MRQIFLLFLLLGSFHWAKAQSDEYPVNVHVSSSHWGMEPGIDRPQAVQKIDVVIDSKKYELQAEALFANFQHGVTLLKPGDYKAKLVTNVHKTECESSQAYELLFPDKKTKKFFVIGMSE